MLKSCTRLHCPGGGVLSLTYRHPDHFPVTRQSRRWKGPQVCCLEKPAAQDHEKFQRCAAGRTHRSRTAGDPVQLSAPLPPARGAIRRTHWPSVAPVPVLIPAARYAASRRPSPWYQSEPRRARRGRVDSPWPTSGRSPRVLDSRDGLEPGDPELHFNRPADAPGGAHACAGPVRTAASISFVMTSGSCDIRGEGRLGADALLLTAS